MKKYFLISIFQIFTLLSFAGSEESLFEKGNAFYQQGKFDQAIQAYEKIVSMGKVSPELYFNLGNAYYKTGNNVSAILNYERAARLAPEDEDIKFNLHMANLKSIDKISPLPDFFLNRWWNSIVQLMNADTWAKFAVAFSFITALFILGFILSSSYVLKKFFFLSIIISVFFLFCTFFISRASWKYQTANSFALLVKNSTYVKSSPDEKSTDLFILHEGIKMKIIDEVGKWKRVRLADGNEGWIKDSELVVI